ncbi:preprotein translocase subunit SecY [Sporolactobacillus sp. Y61]|jgi:preprotein translocase subunit SecY|uniref:Protein translocase subunit SecY n=1 Tax=Sporolactobacillus sp. Y61 TaxID=3160863 RepID=A0AAU8IH39_9BACL|nr:preprotein translocase subunit SecY [Sporolactobacillus sp. THM19-2]RYL89397.1 preprotein translocase subunit SecY [Sporolactobacillus sp. THM19-2]
MFQVLSSMWRDAGIRKKVVFTLLMLIIFRIGTFIPVPDINTELINISDSSAFGLFNTFGGGALQNFSIFSMGVMPYITSSIIVQLLQMDVVPKLTEWSKQGEMGRRKLNQLTRYGTIVLGFIEALGLSFGFNANFPGLVANPNIWTYLIIASVLTTGTAFLMWLGDQITAYGVGNGISILIFAGIVARIPTAINQIYVQRFEASTNAFMEILGLLAIVVIVLLIVVGTIFVQQGIRKIPIQYAKRTVGTKTYSVEPAHLPIKVNAAGVIPVIFAISLMITPPTIARFFPRNNVTDWIVRIFDYSTVYGMIIYAALIIAFTYFYTFVQVNPEKMAKNLGKQGGYIPGIRPGKNTEKFITKILYRLTFLGAIFLAVISLLPIVFGEIGDLPASARIGGTSLLIVVGVALDTMKRIESQLVKKNYHGFIRRR